MGREGLISDKMTEINFTPWFHRSQPKVLHNVTKFGNLLEK